MIMIPLQKCTHLGAEGWQLRHSIGGPSQAFLPQGPVETLDVGLFVFLVGPGNPMSLTVLKHPVGKRPFELWPAIGLDDLHRPGEPASHGGVQERGPILTRQPRSQNHVGFLRIDIHAGKGEDLAKDHGIHLNDRAGSRGPRDDASRLIGPTTRP